MVKITGGAAILLVKDVVKSATYFEECVGFSAAGLWGDPPNFGIVRRDGQAVMLSQVAQDVIVTPNWQINHNMWDVYFWVDDVERMYEELRQRQAIVDYGLCVQPWGVKEFGIQDLDGHDIAFGQIPRPDGDEA